MRAVNANLTAATAHCENRDKRQRFPATCRSAGMHSDERLYRMRVSARQKRMRDRAWSMRWRR